MLLEKRPEIAPASMAIGVMPPSLRRLEWLDLAAPLVEAGCRVSRATVLSERGCLGTLELGGLPGPFNYVLSIPQGDLVRLLRDRLRAWPRVRLLLGREVQGIAQDAQGVAVDVRDVVTGALTAVSSRFVVACDGSRSPTRECIGITVEGKTYAPSFMMGDFPETTAWTGEARLFFTATGSIESFPLPGGMRRWVIQSGPVAPDAAAIVQRVGDVTGVDLEAGRAEWVTCFTPERRLCREYFKGRVVLCGDAAHVMSPIGGQGMNTGLADAWHLSRVLQRLCATGEAPGPLLERYARCRRHAFRVAANRAARGMWLGTLKGELAAAMRSVFVRRVLFGPLMRDRLAPYFAMLTIPDADPFVFLSRMRDDLADPERTRDLNRGLFTLIASRYDEATRFLSLGRDACWKDRLVARLPGLVAPVCLDLACGTGDITRRLAAKYPGGAVIGLDLTEAMLDRARHHGQPPTVRYVTGDMGATGLPDGSVDVVTGAYALRNAGDLTGTLREVWRVLKPGGIAVFLDFSKPANPWGQRIGQGILRVWGGLWGWLLHRDPRVYIYIADSLRRHPDRRQLAALLDAAGFDVRHSCRAFGGLIECLTLEKRS